ncbi:uncharacterized protein LOC143039693 [Oratosquilla oratoria]|uniref:uncharacterized protein LOC143039693 n=1 Tax=Oratosquilla oratoria TaxID=337810 RepID=UPI003F777A0F
MVTKELGKWFLRVKSSSGSKNGNKEKGFISQIYHKMGTLLCILGYQPPSTNRGVEDSEPKLLRCRKITATVAKFFEDYFDVVCVALIMYNVFAVMWITSVIQQAMRNPLPKWFGYWNWFLSILQFLFYPCLAPLFLLGSWAKKKDLVALLRRWECLETYVQVDSARMRSFAKRIFGHGLLRITLGLVSFTLLSNQGHALLLLKEVGQRVYLLVHMPFCFLTVNCPDLLLQLSVYGVSVVMDGLHTRLQQMERELSAMQKRQIVVLTLPAGASTSQEVPATETRDPRKSVPSVASILVDKESSDKEVNKNHFSNVTLRNGDASPDHSTRRKETFRFELTSPVTPPLGGRRRSLGASEVTLSTALVSPERTPSLHPSPVRSHQVSPVRASVRAIHPPRIPTGQELNKIQGNKHAVASMQSDVETIQDVLNLNDPELEEPEEKRIKTTLNEFLCAGNYKVGCKNVTTEKGRACKDDQEVNVNQHRHSSTVCIDNIPLNSFMHNTERDGGELCQKLLDKFREDEQYKKKSSSRINEPGKTTDVTSLDAYDDITSSKDNWNCIGSTNATETKSLTNYTRLYLDMLKVVEATNTALSPFLLLQMVHCIVLTTVGIYYLVAELLNATVVPGALTNVAIILHLFNLIHYYCITTNYGHELMIWTRKLRVTLQTIRLYTKSAEIKDQASEMKDLLESSPLELRASDFFVLGRGLVCSIVSNVITYLVVGLQFSLSCKDPEDNRVSHFDQLLRRSAARSL